jgi:hypothetical protein
VVQRCRAGEHVSNFCQFINLNNYTWSNASKIPSFRIARLTPPFMTYSACLTTSHFSYDLLRRLIHSTDFVDGIWTITWSFLNRYYKYPAVAETKLCGPSRSKVKNGIAEMKSVLVSFRTSILFYVIADQCLGAFGNYCEGTNIVDQVRPGNMNGRTSGRWVPLQSFC